MGVLTPKNTKDFPGMGIECPPTHCPSLGECGHVHALQWQVVNDRNPTKTAVRKGKKACNQLNMAGQSSSTCSQHSALSQPLFILLSFVLTWLPCGEQQKGNSFLAVLRGNPCNGNLCLSWTAAEGMKVLIGQPENRAHSRCKDVGTQWPGLQTLSAGEIVSYTTSGAVTGAQRLGRQKRPMATSNEDKESRRGSNLLGKWTGPYVSSFQAVINTQD